MRGGCLCAGEEKVDHEKHVLVVGNRSCLFSVTKVNTFHSQWMEAKSHVKWRFFGLLSMVALVTGSGAWILVRDTE